MNLLRAALLLTLTWGQLIISSEPLGKGISDFLANLRGEPTSSSSSQRLVIPLPTLERQPQSGRVISEGERIVRARQEAQLRTAQLESARQRREQEVNAVQRAQESRTRAPRTSNTVDSSTTITTTPYIQSQVASQHLTNAPSSRTQQPVDIEANLQALIAKLHSKRASQTNNTLTLKTDDFNGKYLESLPVEERERVSVLILIPPLDWNPRTISAFGHAQNFFSLRRYFPNLLTLKLKLNNYRIDDYSYEKLAFSDAAADMTDLTVNDDYISMSFAK